MIRLWPFEARGMTEEAKLVGERAQETIFPHPEQLLFGKEKPNRFISPGSAPQYGTLFLARSPQKRSQES